MNDVNKEKREFIRTKVRRLTSIVKHDGAYKLIEEDEIRLAHKKEDAKLHMRVSVY